MEMGLEREEGGQKAGVGIAMEGGKVDPRPAEVAATEAGIARQGDSAAPMAEPSQGVVT